MTTCSNPGISTVTVNYHCLWSVIYESVGETPPGAEPNPSWAEINV